MSKQVIEAKADDKATQGADASATKPAKPRSQAKPGKLSKAAAKRLQAKLAQLKADREAKARAVKPVEWVYLPGSEKPLPLGPGNGGRYGATKARDTVWCERKQQVFAALIELGATSEAKAVDTTAIVARLEAMGAGNDTPRPEYTRDRMARHYPYCAATAGLCGVVAVSHRKLMYITPAGVKYYNEHTKGK